MVHRREQIQVGKRAALPEASVTMHDRSGRCFPRKLNAVPVPVRAQKPPLRWAFLVLLHFSRSRLSSALRPHVLPLAALGLKTGTPL